MLYCLTRLALYSLDINLVKLLNKELTVLGIHNGLNGSSKHLNIIFLKNALAVEFNATVERCLSAKRQQDAVGTLFLYYLLNKVRLYRKEIDLISYAL